MNDCIIKNSTSNSNLLYDIDTKHSKLVFINLTYINNKGNMWLGYATINNSYFADNVGAALGLSLIHICGTSKRRSNLYRMRQMFHWSYQEKGRQIGIQFIYCSRIKLC